MTPKHVHYKTENDVLTYRHTIRADKYVASMQIDFESKEVYLQTKIQVDVAQSTTNPKFILTKLRLLMNLQHISTLCSTESNTRENVIDVPSFSVQ